MRTTEVIEHSGAVTGVDGNQVSVVVVAQSACASCNVKGVCGMSESEEKTVHVLVEDPEEYVIGDRVVVSIEKGMGIKAAVYAYIYPFFLLLAVLLVMLHGLELGEVVSGLSALGSLVVYYIVLALFKHKISGEIIFKIRKE